MMTCGTRRCLLIALPALCLGHLARAAEQANGPPVAAGHREVLLHANQSWNGKAYTQYPVGQPELTMIRLRIPAHSALPWHTHPFPNAGYVLSGELTIQDRDSGKSHTFHAGEAFAESVDDVHRGVAGDAPTVLILTYSGAGDTPISKPVKGGKGGILTPRARHRAGG